MSTLPWPGMSVKLGATEYVVPPLSMRAVRDLTPDFEIVSKTTNVGMSPEVINAMGRILLAAFKRNYPDMELDQLLDMLDPTNMGDIFVAIASSSGLKQGEGRAPMANMNRSIGTEPSEPYAQG
jgi:hypothetical protein